MPVNFTVRMVERLKPKDREYVLREKKGVALRVYPTGKKTWLAIYQFDGKRKWFRLGDFPSCDLDDAKDRYSDAMQLLKRGVDPAAEELSIKAENISKLTVDDLIKKYIEQHAMRLKRSWKIDERILTGEVSALWGKRKAENITKRDVVRLLEIYIERDSPTMSNKVLAVVRKMFSFAVERAILEDTPVKGVRPLGQENAKERVLSDKEIKQFWELLGDKKLIMSDEVRRALKLVLVTAQRPGECIGINRGEIEDRWWTIPKERAKNKRAHKVYLTDLALSLLSAPPKQKFIFESPRVGKASDLKVPRKPKAIGSNALPRAMGLNYKADVIDIEKFTPHDLRRTATTGMAGLRVPSEVLKKILNHHDKRDVTLIYNRHIYEDEIQEALEKWSARLLEIIGQKEE